LPLKCTFAKSVSLSFVHWAIHWNHINFHFVLVFLFFFLYPCALSHSISKRFRFDVFLNHYNLCILCSCSFSSDSAFEAKKIARANDFPAAISVFNRSTLKRHNRATNFGNQQREKKDKKIYKSLKLWWGKFDWFNKNARILRRWTENEYFLLGKHHQRKSSFD
jgi:hypothetical protein